MELRVVEWLSPQKVLVASPWSQPGQRRLAMCDKQAALRTVDLGSRDAEA